MDYRGELIAKFKITTDAIPAVYQPGDKFAQLVIVPIYLLDPVFVDELSKTERDTDGFGSSDNKQTVEEEIVEEKVEPKKLIYGVVTKNEVKKF